MSMGSWGSSTGEGISFLNNVLATYDPQRRTGPANQRRFSSAELDALLARAASTMDDPAREALLHEAVRWSASNVPLFPLVHLTNVWAHRRALTVEPRMDERTLAMSVGPN